VRHLRGSRLLALASMLALAAPLDGELPAASVAKTFADTCRKTEADGPAPVTSTSGARAARRPPLPRPYLLLARRRGKSPSGLRTSLYRD